MNEKQRNKVNQQRKRRIGRVRAKVSGTATRPRLAVNRSLRYISAQLIDDTAGKTLASVHQKNLKITSKGSEAAAEVGKVLAKAAQDAGVQEVVFDRRFYKYHGRVKAFADAVREGGIKF